ncbi:MAG: hypothetical protein IAE82_00605 [Opitutaceae bacterium]|nr:hypothetical protein [Opitutaceae bacterium]
MSGTWDAPQLIRPGHNPTGFAAPATLIHAELQDRALTSYAGAPLAQGAAIELGYFDQATIYELFAGAWMPLIGADAPRANRGIAPILVGQGGEPAGMFSWCRTFFAGVDALAPVGRPLALRIYEPCDTNAARFYNTVSHPAWWFREPRSPSPAFVGMSLDETALRWESGPAGAFRTILRHRRHALGRRLGGWRRALGALRGTA